MTDDTPKLYDGDLIVRGGKLLIHFASGDVDMGVPPMSYRTRGTLEVPPMWLTPRVLDEELP